MRRYAAGDVSAFRALYSRYEKRIYNFFVRRLGNPDRASDLFQEAFLRLHGNRHRFDSRQSFAAWFFTIANNLVRDDLRGRRGIQFQDLEEEELSLASPGAGPEQMMELSELKEKIESALATVPDAQKEVLLLSRFEGLRHSEIAEITGRSEVAVRQLLYRVLRNLRREFGDL